jgi:Rieske [2Fe-2S] domain
VARFIHNCWYAVGWSEELGAQPLGRAVLDQRIVLWRDENRAPVAMRDRCLHRLASGRQPPRVTSRASEGAVASTFVSAWPFGE